MKVIWPIKVTESSYPFSTMKHARVPLDISEYDFIEERVFYKRDG